VWFNGQTPDDSAWASITHRLTAAGIPLRIAHKAIQLPGRWKDVDLALLPRPAPAGFRTDWSENENSLVLSLQFGRFSAIFTGDIEQKAERFLLPYLHRIDLLKVAHHGSATSSSDAFLQAVRPRLAIAQSNDGGRYNLPNPRIEARYKQHRIPFWVTGRCGAVQIQTNGDGFSIEPYAPNDYLRTFCRL
jgi:competence protein ComEC